MSEPLDCTPVYRNLRFTSAWFGLTPLDLPFLLVPGGVVVLGCMLSGVSTMWGSVTSVAIGAALVAAKWRKPDDYLEMLLHAATAPRRLSHKERDRVLLPFPLDAALRERGLSAVRLPPKAEAQADGTGPQKGRRRCADVERGSTEPAHRSTGPRGQSHSDAAPSAARFFEGSSA